MRKSEIDEFERMIGPELISKNEVSSLTIRNYELNVKHC